MDNEPRIAREARHYLVVYKPPRMHSAPIPSNPRGSLVEWCAARYPEIAALQGRRPGEGGLLHRLDYETRGLALVARTQDGFDRLLAQQAAGGVIKEYAAVTAPVTAGGRLPGFPLPRPRLAPRFVIESAFRAYGLGRKVSRPCPGTGYRTEVVENRSGDNGTRAFVLRITRGFRHQIRCHLAWLGYPILNDALYGGARTGDGILALRAVALRFTDPGDGDEREVRDAD